MVCGKVGIEIDISYALHQPRMKSIIKGKARDEGDHLTPNIV